MPSMPQWENSKPFRRGDALARLFRMSQPWLDTVAGRRGKRLILTGIRKRSRPATRREMVPDICSYSLRSKRTHTRISVLPITTNHRTGVLLEVFSHLPVFQRRHNSIGGIVIQESPAYLACEFGSDQRTLDHEDLCHGVIFVVVTDNVTGKLSLKVYSDGFHF